MFTPIIINDDENHRVFFTSDTHFCHDQEFIWGIRGFTNITDHDEGIIKAWNSRVRRTDSVIHLGDFMLYKNGSLTDKFLELFGRLNGNIHYIWGNHDKGLNGIYQTLAKNQNEKETYPLKVYRKDFFPEKDGCFDFWGNQCLFMINEQLVFCSHFAHRIWFKSHKGVWHVCGHSHGNDPESNPDFQNGKRLDCGIESFPSLLSYQELKEIMENKTIDVTDHHTLHM